jgi:hypothetical protein
MLTAINISIQLNWASRCKNRTCGLNIYIFKNSESIRNSTVYNQVMESLFISTTLIQTTHTLTNITQVISIKFLNTLTLYPKLLAPL